MQESKFTWRYFNWSDIFQSTGKISWSLLDFLKSFLQLPQNLEFHQQRTVIFWWLLKSFLFRIQFCVRTLVKEQKEPKYLISDLKTFTNFIRNKLMKFFFSLSGSLQLFEKELHHSYVPMAKRQWKYAQNTFLKCSKFLLTT